MYARFIKRLLDILISLLALSLLMPLLVILTVTGAIVMKGNPFFVQRRPGKNERIFRLLKFRTMSNQKDNDGELLCDNSRLTKYGRILRATSIDELPEFINILLGQLSLVGPRPLAVQYLPYYTPEEHRRHSVMPGLTGLAQINGRNATTWENRFTYDLQYVDNLSFGLDVKIMLLTVKTVLCHTGIGTRGVDSLEDFDAYRKKKARTLA